MANWMDFSMSPLRAAREMHVSPRDVARGAQVDAVERARRAYMKENARLRSAEDASAMRRSQNEAPRMYAGELKQAPRSDLISNALLAGNLGGLSAAFGTLAPLRAGLAVGAGADAVLGAKAGEGDIPAALSGAGMLGRRALPVALASGAAYAADAEAGPLSGLIKFLRSGVEPRYVVKQKGGNWINNSVEDALRGLKRPRRVEVTDEEWSPGTPLYRSEPTELDNWISGPLTKYVKTRMASPDDEVRKLAEQGVLHFTPEPSTGEIWPGRTIASKQVFGLAPDWEQAADAVINQSPASTYQNFGSSNLGEEWINKLNPETPFYRATQQLPRELGFSHLIDELNNALNPNSGLPPHLQLTPEAVKQMSMEKAVRRVADINAHRAAQQAAANQELANKAMVVREYADEAMPNPKGLRWVELKANDQPAEMSDDALRAVMKERDMYPDEIEAALADPKQRAEIAKMAGTDAELEKQLKYEGDTMGHCVGGYCDDVLSGRSRIFSLRDAKGEPHVTVEVAPQPRNIGQQDIPDNYIDSAMEQLGIHEPEAQWGREEEIDRLAGDLWKKDNPDLNFITQIKGKQNRKPNDEYLPFVQDFVRNNPLGGQWSDVGDLGNTGLIRGNKGSFLTRDEYIAQPEVQATLESQLKSFPGMSREDLITEMLKVKGSFASGGTVQKDSHPPADIRGIIAAMKEYHAHA